MTRKTTSEMDTLSSLTQTSAARLIGVSRGTLGNSDCPRNADGTYSGPALVQWFLERQLAKNVTDPLLVGSSPNLERYRKSKADLAELDVAARRRELVDVAEMRDVLGSCAARVRQLGAELQKAFGTKAKRMFDDTLQDCGKIGNSIFEERETDESGNNGKPTR